LLRAHRLPQEREHDDDAREARHHQQDRRREREHGQQNDDLQSGGQFSRLVRSETCWAALVNGAAGVVEMAAAGVARGEWRIALVEPSGISPGVSCASAG